MGQADHQRQAAEQARRLRCGVITISDTRTEADDQSGALIQELLRLAGHHIEHYQIVPDEPDQIAGLVLNLSSHCDLIITSGGTGITRRDSSFEAIDGLLEKRMPGFGELFRMLSYAEIGAAAMLSRATAGLLGKCLVFCTPGSVHAVRLALEQLILPDLDHFAWEVIRQ